MALERRLMFRLQMSCGSGTDTGTVQQTLCRIAMLYHILSPVQFTQWLFFGSRHYSFSNTDTSGRKRRNSTRETCSRLRTESCLPETRSPRAPLVSSECPTTKELETPTWARRWATDSVCLARVPPTLSPTPSLRTNKSLETCT